jgi:hypothetical protein
MSPSEVEMKSMAARFRRLLTGVNSRWYASYTGQNFFASASEIEVVLDHDFPVRADLVADHLLGGGVGKPLGPGGHHQNGGERGE